MSETRIRTFEARDRTELRDLFGRAGQESPTATLWGHEDSEAAVYLDPYMDLEPESLFVALADGVFTGYLTGCVDSSRIPGESERLSQAIKRYRLFLHPAAVAFFARSAWDLAVARMQSTPPAEDFSDDRWPAHLHINVVPEVRGTGVADGLMHRWLDRLVELVSPGCHLQTLVENERAVRFFERMGFAGYGPTPVVPGARHDRGARPPADDGVVPRLTSHDASLRPPLVR